MNSTLPYLTAILSVGVAYCLVALIVWAVVFPPEWRQIKLSTAYLVFVLVLSLLLIIPFDRFCEERMNWLEKRPNQK